MPTRTRDTQRRRQSTSEHGASSSPKTKTQAQTQRSKADDKDESTSGASIPLPYVTAQLHTTRIALPSVPGSDQVTGTVIAVRDRLPSPEKMLFYGGLTAAAAFSVIEWPVAAAIGIGAAVMQRRTAQD